MNNLIGILVRVTASATVIFLMGCASSAPTPILRPSNINGRPNAYAGKSVVVEGFIVLGDQGKMGGHVIIESKSISDEEDDKYSSSSVDFDPKKYLGYCLNIENPERLYREIKRYNRTTRRLKGIVVKGEGELGSCSGDLSLRLDE